MSEEEFEIINEINLLDDAQFDAALDQLYEERDFDAVCNIHEARRKAIAATPHWQASDPADTDPPARRELPANPGKARDEDLIAWAKGETGPEKISFARSNELGGPDNPRVAEMMRRGLVEGLTVTPTPAESIQADGGVSRRAPITDGAKARYEEAKAFQKKMLEDQKKAAREAERRRKDPRRAARERMREELDKLSPEMRHQVIEGAVDIEMERMWGRQ